MAPHSSTLAWKIPWMEEPSGLQSQGHKELDTIEQLNMHACIIYDYTHIYIHPHTHTDTVHRHAAAAAAKSLQSCPTLCDPRDGSPPGSPIPGILQARTLEWVAISFFNA